MLTRVVVAFDARLVGEVVDPSAFANGRALVSTNYLRPLAFEDAPVGCACGRIWLTEERRVEYGHDACEPATPPDTGRKARRTAAA